MQKKIKDIFLRNSKSDMSIRERMFRLLIVVGGIAVVLATLECAIVLSNPVAEIHMVVLDIVVAIAIVLTYKFRKVELAETLVGITITAVTLPSMFFSGGGIDSGMAVWFILGFVYSFLLFTGRKLLFFVILNLAVDVAVYGIAYLHPEYVVPIGGEYAIYTDSLFSMMMVGVFCGILIYFQIYLYEKESEMVKKQSEELKKANRVQNSFFTNMSHEIRTPINSIIGLNEMILRKSEDPEVCGYARDIQTSSKLLLDLINDILDMSKLKQNKMEIVEVEYRPEEVFRDVVEMLQIRVAEKRLDFRVHVDNQLPSVLYGDARHLEQIMINILTNAVKYTNDGKVMLNVESEPAGEGSVQLRIEVKDTGIGIRKEDLDHLYDSFRRMDMEKNNNVEGSGLGLSITKQLVNLMEGEIKVDSVYTKGSTFTVTVKQKVIDSTPIGEINLFRGESKGTKDYYEHTFESPEARILLVDDNEMNALVIGRLLQDTKVQVDVVKSGAECIAMTKKKFYHVILMDYMMPDMDGGDTLKIVRRQENGLCNETPVILLTANSAADANRISEVFGFDSFLEKPIRSDKLESEILRFLPEDIVEFRRMEVTEEAEEYPLLKNRKKRLLITTDCVCDLPEYILEKYDIRVMYLYIRMGEARFADTKEIDSDCLIQLLGDPNVTIRTDGVSVGEYEDFFADALTEAENVLHISMASRSGKTYEAAVAAARGFDHVQVIDSGQVSSGQGLLVMKAAQMQYAGHGIEDICSELDRLKRRVVSRFVLADVNDFYQSGYTGKGAAGFMNMLAAHPIVAMHRSRMQFQGFLLGDLKKAWKRYLRRLMRNKRQIDSEIIFVAYVGLSYQQQEYLRELIEQNSDFEQVVFHKASFSSACNTGLYTIGVAFLKKGGD